MTVREQVVSKLKVLSDEQLKQIADFLDFLEFRENKDSNFEKDESPNDGIFNLGKNPVETGITDASDNLDKYLY